MLTIVLVTHATTKLEERNEVTGTFDFVAAPGGIIYICNGEALDCYMRGGDIIIDIPMPPEIEK